jgi:hypothetical protein
MERGSTTIKPDKELFTKEQENKMTKILTKALGNKIANPKDAE